jgi:hypothetical protein
VKPAPKTQAANNLTAIPAVPAQPTPEEDSEISAAVLQVPFIVVSHSD